MMQHPQLQTSLGSTDSLGSQLLLKNAKILCVSQEQSLKNRAYDCTVFKCFKNLSSFSYSSEQTNTVTPFYSEKKKIPALKRLEEILLKL